VVWTHPLEAPYGHYSFQDFLFVSKVELSIGRCRKVVIIHRRFSQDLAKSAVKKKFKKKNL
jgi:hypothetical protein